MAQKICWLTQLVENNSRHAHIWRHYFRIAATYSRGKNEFEEILRSLSRFSMPREWGFVFETLNLLAESPRWHDEIDNFSAWNRQVLIRFVLGAVKQGPWDLFSPTLDRPVHGKPLQVSFCLFHFSPLLWSSKVHEQTSLPNTRLVCSTSRERSLYAGLILTEPGQFVYTFRVQKYSTAPHNMAVVTVAYGVLNVFYWLGIKRHILNLRLSHRKERLVVELKSYFQPGSSEAK